MKFCLNIWLKSFDQDNEKDLSELTDLFEDVSLMDFLDDNVYAKYIYLIKEDDNTIGFVYLMPYKNSKIYDVRYGIDRAGIVGEDGKKHQGIYDVRYGIVENKLNNDYVYTVLTLIRDKVKGYDNSTEIKDSTIITSVRKFEEKYNVVANTFGNKIYEDEKENFYEINPNCEQIEEENKIIKYYLNRKAM